MSGPPETVSPDLLLARLQEMPRPSTVVDFPRHDEEGKPVGQIRLWVLKQGELILCQTAADKTVQKLMKDKVARDQLSRGYDEAYQNAQASEILAIACRQVANANLPFFPEGASQINRLLSGDEISVLFEQYAQWQTESGPIVGHMSNDEMDAWIKVLGEGGGKDILPFCSREVLTTLIRYMASRSSNSSTDTSLSG